MSVRFVDIERQIAVADMANVTAAQFVGITRVLTASYTMPNPISVTNRAESILGEYDMFMLVQEAYHKVECLVQPEGFCRLVERQMAMPRSFFYGWAETAAGMYEQIKGCRYRWSWVEAGDPKSFTPIFHGALTRPSEKTCDTLIGINPKQDLPQ